MTLWFWCGMALGAGVMALWAVIRRARRRKGHSTKPTVSSDRSSAVLDVQTQAVRTAWEAEIWNAHNALQDAEAAQQALEAEIGATLSGLPPLPKRRSRGWVEITVRMGDVYVDSPYRHRGMPKTWNTQGLRCIRVKDAQMLQRNFFAVVEATANLPPVVALMEKLEDAWTVAVAAYVAKLEQHSPGSSNTLIASLVQGVVEATDNPQEMSNALLMGMEAAFQDHPELWAKATRKCATTMSLFVFPN